MVAPVALLAVLVELEEPQAVEIYLHPAVLEALAVLILVIALVVWVGHQPLEVVPLVDKRILLAFLLLIHMVPVVAVQVRA